MTTPAAGRPSIHSLLRIPYLILITVTIGSGVGYVVGRNAGVGWLADWSPNAGTSALSILLTVWLIDSVIEQSQEQERRRMCRAAFRALRVPLARHVGLLADMFKASASSVPVDHPIETPALFNDVFFSELPHLDFSKPAPVVGPGQMQWFDYVAMEMKTFQEALAQVANRYVTFLDPQTTETIEALLASDLLNLLLHGPSIRNSDLRLRMGSPYPLLSGQGTGDVVRVHTQLLSDLISQSDDLLKDASRPSAVHLHRTDVAPKVGSARA
jgi:hypothetical protein